MIQLPFITGAVHDEAVAYLKAHKKDLLERFASDAMCPPTDNPFTIFMAGSPGAGKTEYSRTWIKETGAQVSRIDTDDVRDWFPMYQGNNSAHIQHAAALGVQKLYDHILKKKKSAILDTTFTPYEKMEENVRRSLDHGRYVEIHYIFQDPIAAWEFTKKREAVEGRFVPVEVFVEALFESRENVKRIKGKFGSDVKVTFVIKDFRTDNSEYFFGINEIDKRTEIPYSKDELTEVLVAQKHPASDTQPSHDL